MCKFRELHAEDYRETFRKGLFIYYVQNIFWKANISYPLIYTYRYANQGVKMWVFRKILRTYELNDS